MRVSCPICCALDRAAQELLGLKLQHVLCKANEENIASVTSSFRHPLPIRTPSTHRLGPPRTQESRKKIIRCVQKGGERCHSSEVGQWEEDSLGKKQKKNKIRRHELKKKVTKKVPKGKMREEQRDLMKRNKTRTQKGGNIIKAEEDKERQSMKVKYGNGKELHHHQVMRMR